MQPQSPYHPAPPDPRDVPPEAMDPYTHAPSQPYPAPEFAPPPATPRPREGQEYSFIMDQPVPRPQPQLFGPNMSLNRRLFMILGGIFIFFIIVVMIKNSFGGSGLNKPSLLLLTEDQQELIHLSTEAAAQQGADTQTMVTASTIEASITSDQVSLISYLAKNHVKINPVTLNIKESKATDLQLTNAAESGLYDQTYTTIMQNALTGYEADLKHAYSLAAGPNGKSILKSEYSNAQLLLVQLTSPIG